MKYFTPEWWDLEEPDTQAVVERYWKYVESIEPLLTRDLVVLLKEISLHDAKLRDLQVNTADRCLKLVLDGFVDPWTPEGCAPRRFTLVYEGLRHFGIKMARFRTVFRSDLGYHELERLGDGAFEHRLLFAEETEFMIQFEELRLSFVDLKEPQQ